MVLHHQAYILLLMDFLILADVFIWVLTFSGEAEAFPFLNRVQVN